MKTQLRIMATVVGILVSGVVVAMPSQPAHSTLTVNPGVSAGTQSTGGQSNSPVRLPILLVISIAPAPTRLSIWGNGRAATYGRRF